MSYDEGRGAIVLFGGIGWNGFLTDTWEFDGSTWAPVTSTTVPPPRWGAAMAYDSARGVTVLFGGHRPGEDNLLADTWEYDGVDWHLVTPTVSPPARYGHAMAYDRNRGVASCTGAETPAAPSTIPGNTMARHGYEYPRSTRLSCPWPSRARKVFLDRPRWVPPPPGARRYPSWTALHGLQGAGPFTSCQSSTTSASTAAVISTACAAAVRVLPANGGSAADAPAKQGVPQNTA